VVMLTPGSPQENITALSPWVFRMYPSIRHEITELVRFTVRDLGILSFACIYPDIDIGIQGYAALQSVIQEENAELVFANQYSADLSNLKRVLSSLTDATADVIVIPDYAERVGVVANRRESFRWQLLHSFFAFFVWTPKEDCGKVFITFW
jgi:ABC-type branched-subunit amino acid transport system substrate-binding protein